jgi:hypothetical protein
MPRADLGVARGAIAALAARFPVQRGVSTLASSLGRSLVTIINRLPDAILADELIPKIAGRHENLRGWCSFSIVYKIDRPSILVGDNNLNGGIGVVFDAPMFRRGGGVSPEVKASIDGGLIHHHRV